MLDPSAALCTHNASEGELTGSVQQGDFCEISLKKINECEICCDFYILGSIDQIHREKSKM